MNYLSYFFNSKVLVFFCLTLVNVMLSTIKSIITVKGSRTQATLINAISYGFYTIVIKQITAFDVSITVAVTICANLIGVYSSMWFLSKLKKDKLWTISVTADTLETGKNITKQLNEKDIGFRVYEIVKKNRKTYGIDIFSETQNESSIIKNILKSYDVKYHVVEVMKNL